ncbi:hypothetical protein GQ600_5672 [Phytophthora cactorum]|nr:hypothetical protein GQ600_5672 [Phytophthora cactorum]
MLRSLHRSLSQMSGRLCVTKKTDTQPQAQVGLQANRLSVNDEALKTADLLREAGANTKSILKFIVDNSDSNRTLRNVQNQIRNLKKCELGVTTRSHRVKKGLLDFCAVPGNTGRIFVNSSNEKCALINKAFTELGGLKTLFPDVRILLCQFHVVKHLPEEVACSDYGLSSWQEQA